MSTVRDRAIFPECGKVTSSLRGRASLLAAISSKDRMSHPRASEGWGQLSTEWLQ